MTETVRLTPVAAVPSNRLLRLVRQRQTAPPPAAQGLRPKPPHLDRLEKALWNKLAFAKRGAAGYRSLEEMYEGYLAARKTVADKAGQLRRLFEAIARMNLEYRPLGSFVPEALRRRTVKARTDALVRRMGYKPPALARATLYDLRQSPADCYAVWSREVRGFIGDVVAALYAALDRCVEQEIVGRITWTEPTSCSFTFFREVVVCHDDVRFERRSGNEVWTGTHTYRHAVHRHEVINAKEHQTRPKDLFLPQRVGDAWGLIPAWLRPHLRFVTGTQTRERIVERDLGTETWEHTDRTLLARDPAIVLDGYVLTGWGTLDRRREAEAGTGRREPVPKRSAWRRLLSLLGMAA